VAVFVTEFLPYSQTFVQDELQAHDRYQADVFCTRRLGGAKPTDPTVHVGGSFYACTRVSAAFDRRLVGGDYALIHAHFGGGGVYALPFARRYQLPLVVTFHGYDVPLLSSGERLYPKFWPYALLAPAVLREMTLGLCASIELYEMLGELGVPRARLRLHPIGIDVRRFAPGDRGSGAEPLVVMVGRFVAKKGLRYGLRAFAEVRRRRGRGRLVIVGDGELRASLEQTAREEGVTSHVTFTGALGHAEVAALLGIADVLLAPSVTTANGDRESGTLVIKEAGASGAVAVATWHGGHAEIIDDGRTGFLVPERHVASMAERLDQLLGDAALRRRLGEAARTKVMAQYDNRIRVAALERAYDSVARAG
jgi:colanic acid/amylovoran biosynthesis glycosyltransferase